jgi:hypothetical protein
MKQLSDIVEERKEILVKYFKEEEGTEVDIEDIELEPTGLDCVFDTPEGEYTVLTDDEAQEEAKEYIKQSLWSFNSYFLLDYLPDGVTEEVIEALRPQCEGANEAILSMVGDKLDELVEDATGADGIGHYLNTYAGYADEFKGYVIFKSN